MATFTNDAKAGHPPSWMLQAFTMRMAGHGFSVSGTMMNADNGYALEQLRHAHTLADSSLRELAVELFRYFERRSTQGPINESALSFPAPRIAVSNFLSPH